MIISKTPLRVSFAGGGTDIKKFYKNDKGQVISSSINKYLYVVIKKQLGIVEYKYRINWSRVEFKNRISEIDHPIVRETLKLLNIDFPIQISTFSDIPAETGMGSSSAFTVGLVNALYALVNKKISKHSLASLAAEIEIKRLKRPIGKQDHYASSFGGLNKITFNSNESVSVENLNKSSNYLNYLSDKLLLFYLDMKRDASEVLYNQVKSIKEKRKVLIDMSNQVDIFKNIILSEKKFNRFGLELNKGWKLKKSLTNEISNPKIDSFYERAIKAGAIGGKVLGAGGGGFLLLYVNKKDQSKVKKSLKELYCMNIEFETEGSIILYNDRQDKKIL